MRFWRRPRTAEPAPPAESWSLEVQIHPSDIRKRVRYLFLTRVQVTFLSLIALGYILFLAFGAALAPGIIGGLLNHQEYSGLASERARQGERLQQLLQRLADLENQADGLYLGINKVYLAYGLPRERTAAAGEGLFAGEEVPDSIYAGAIQEGNRLRGRIRQRLGVLDASLTEVRRFETDHADRVRLTPAVCPLRGDFVLTSSFRRRRSPFTRELDFHAGLDLAAPEGTPIHAPAEGVVAFAGQSPVGQNAIWWRFGNLVILRHGDLFYTVYGHCQELRVRTGQTVRRGDVLATVGNTGWSTSPHLHYEIRRNAGSGDPRPVDPTVHILDRRWQNDDRLLMGGPVVAPSGSWEQLPTGIVR
jgi:murein DD-endopeptidase MepM/ murein hydrolase activator NlpD